MVHCNHPPTSFPRFFFIYLFFDGTNRDCTTLMVIPLYVKINTLAHIDSVWAALPIEIVRFSTQCPLQLAPQHWANWVAAWFDRVEATMQVTQLDCSTFEFSQITRLIQRFTVQNERIKTYLGK